MNGGGQGEWELKKENIQPLSTGRRMAYLEESLPICSATGFNDQHQYEEHHLKEICKMEEVAVRNQGEDPLQSWVDMIKYLEQHFPTMSPNIKNRYSELLKKIVEKFMHDERYRNDRRFAHTLIKAVEIQATPERQKALFLRFLDSDICSKLSDIYKYLAESYDREGDSKRATEILKRGISNDAQPKEILEEMLTCIQQNWAQRFAKQLQQGEMNHESGAGAGRNFASSVPIVGENNEAVSIRHNLQPAAPTTSSKPRQATHNSQATKRTLPVYKEGTGSSQYDLENTSSSEGPSKKLPVFDHPEIDRENRLEAARWNTDNAQLTTPAIPEPREKLQLFVEKDVEDNVHSSSSLPGKAPVDKRVLKERKVEEEPPSESITTEPQPQPPSRETNTKQDQDRQIKANASPAVPATVDENEIRELYEAEWDVRDRLREINAQEIYQQLNDAEVNEFMECEEIIYKPIDEFNRIENDEMIWWQKMEQELMKLRNTQHLRIKISCLTEENDCMKDKADKVERALAEKGEKLQSLEKHSEDLMHNLTKITTENNLRETFFHREKTTFMRQIEELKSMMEGEKKAHQEQISLNEANLESLKQENKVFQDEVACFKAKVEALEQKLNFITEPSNEAKEAVRSNSEAATLRTSQLPQFDRTQANSIIMEISQQKKCSTNETSNMSVDRSSVSVSGSASSESGGASTSKFGSGDTTVAGNSFMPCMSMMDCSKNVSEHPPPRKALGIVERHLYSDLMNITPAAAPLDDLVNNPSLSIGVGIGGFKMKPMKSYALYESYSDSFSQSKQQNNRNGKINSFASGRRLDSVKSLKTLPENMSPTLSLKSEPEEPVLRTEEVYVNPSIQAVQPPFEPLYQEVNPPSVENDGNENFLKPGLPARRTMTNVHDENTLPPAQTISNENSRPDFMQDPNSDISRRLSILRKRSMMPSGTSLSDEEDEDIIVRRHQQTGLDLNVSNLTMALTLGPQPLINSTPEREKTLREIQFRMGPGPVPYNKDQEHEPPEVEDTPDFQGNMQRMSRYNSVLNDPPLNLSTIQETSRENRSRSTTSSSSGMGMSATRFGMQSTTHGHTSNNYIRSSSIPRSASRTSGQGSGACGYYSDTNTK